MRTQEKLNRFYDEVERFVKAFGYSIFVNRKQSLTRDSINSDITYTGLANAIVIDNSEVVKQPKPDITMAVLANKLEKMHDIEVSWHFMILPPQGDSSTGIMFLFFKDFD